MWNARCKYASVSAARTAGYSQLIVLCWAQHATCFTDAEWARARAPVFESVFRKRIQIHVARTRRHFAWARMNALVTFFHFFPDNRRVPLPLRGLFADFSTPGPSCVRLRTSFRQNIYALKCALFPPPFSGRASEIALKYCSHVER